MKPAKVLDAIKRLAGFPRSFASSAHSCRPRTCGRRPPSWRPKGARRSPRDRARQLLRRLLLQAAEKSTARDRAIVALLRFTGLRPSEAAALQIADMRISARKGLVVVRSGKGDAYTLSSRSIDLACGASLAAHGWSCRRTCCATRS